MSNLFLFLKTASSLCVLLICSLPLYAQDCPFCDLRGQDFSGQNLTNVNFNGAILDNANFSNATLNGAVFTHASLIGANFTGASLGSTDKGPANFSLADLTNAKFKGASLKSAQLSHALMTGTDYTNSNLKGVNFGFQIKFLYGPMSSRPIFNGSTLDCEVAKFEDQVDLRKSKFPNCKESLISKFPTPVKYIENDDPSHNGYAVRVKFPVVSESRLDDLATSGTCLAPGDTIRVDAGKGVDNANCGTSNCPCQSISYAINKAPVSGVVAINYGKYSMPSTLQITKSITISGGYYNNQPAPSTQSSVAGPVSGAPIFSANGAGAVVIVNNLILNGSRSTPMGSNTAVLQGTNGATIELHEVNINVGIGGPGADGTTGLAGSTGVSGGQEQVIVGVPWRGGKGGLAPAPCGAVSNGANGGGRTSMDSKLYFYPGFSGDPGSTGVRAPGSAPIGIFQRNLPDGCPTPGYYITPAGGPGANALDCGTAGQPNPTTLGSFKSGVWVGVAAGQGGSGGHGGGGGGGASGVGCLYGYIGGSTKYNGTAGGGGGSGGCGAIGGTGGMQGGAAFGLILIDANVILDNTVKITGGRGGAGGTGGQGNLGGDGGPGGPGEPSPTPYKDNTPNLGDVGGAGGNGGSGASSGGGAGGNGGPAFGIAQVGTAVVTGTPVFYPGASGTVGQGGQAFGKEGIPCKGVNGVVGLPGPAANTQTFTNQ